MPDRSLAVFHNHCTSQHFPETERVSMLYFDHRLSDSSDLGFIQMVPTCGSTSLILAAPWCILALLQVYRCPGKGWETELYAVLISLPLIMLFQTLVIKLNQLTKNCWHGPVASNASQVWLCWPSKYPLTYILRVKTNSCWLVREWCFIYLNTGSPKPGWSESLQRFLSI